MVMFVKETAIPLVHTLHLTTSGKEEAQVLSGRTLLHIIPAVLYARNLPHVFILFLLITSSSAFFWWEEGLSSMSSLYLGALKPRLEQTSASRQWYLLVLGSDLGMAHDQEQGNKRVILGF